MARKLKVYGWHGFRPDELAGHVKQTDEIVAAHSIAEVLRITGMTRSEWSYSGHETGNEHQIQVAMADPGVVYWTELDTGIRADAQWRRDDPAVS